jgi:hypothetical protein
MVAQKVCMVCKSILNPLAFSVIVLNTKAKPIEQATIVAIFNPQTQISSTKSGCNVKD